jgi:hypothetical protein
MSRSWFIARNKQRFGPFSENQIQQLARLGLVLPTEYVLPEGSTKWVLARSATGPLARPTGTEGYWVSIGGKPVGPLSGDQVREGLRGGRFRGETLVRPEGASDWGPLARLTEFRDVLSLTGRDSRAHLGEADLPLTPEEAELHLAGKRGDRIAALLSHLLGLRRRYAANSSMVELIDRNVEDLRAMRAGVAAPTRRR